MNALIAGMSGLVLGWYMHAFVVSYRRETDRIDKLINEPRLDEKPEQ